MLKLKDFKPRLYQESILSSCVNYNTLVVLPTGMGKTAVAMLLAYHRLNTYPDSKVIILAPTKPLVQQHIESSHELFDFESETDAVLFTGEINPKKREDLWKNAKLIFSTPQGMENDIITKKILLDDVSLIVFDEAHRATGNYAYNFIAEQYNKSAKFPRILALTASPGNNIEKIEEVCRNLHIENIEVRTDSDPDVKPYIQQTNIEWVEVDLPEEFVEVKKILERATKNRLIDLQQYGITHASPTMGKSQMLELQRALHADLAHGEKDFDKMKAISILAEIMKIQHALELIETQGIVALRTYFEHMWQDSATSKVKAVKNVVNDVLMKEAFAKTVAIAEKGLEHTKFHELKKIIVAQLNKDADSKIIVFSQFRDTGVCIKQSLSDISIIKAEVFVGQQKKQGSGGMSQKVQKAAIDDFRENKFNVLISTSVGEEGLDIPKVDLVVFYEAVPSAIRQIQRRGRTGRLSKGAVKILITKGTRDEGYRWSAHHKEKRMKRILLDMRQKIRFQNNVAERPQVRKSSQINISDDLPVQRDQKILSSFIKKADAVVEKPLAETKASSDKEKNVVIFVDHREKGSAVIKHLLASNVSVELRQLTIGDFILSDRVCIEYKTIPDFVNSILDKRIFEQAKALKQRFERPIIIVQGTEDIYGQRQMHPNAINGVIATLLVNFGIPILWTKDSVESADFLIAIAKREQLQGGVPSMHDSRKPLSERELQEYIVSSFPGIGASLAPPLLRKFKTIKDLINAKEEDLQTVDKIGPQKAKQMRDIFDKEYGF